jgi:hypothetical protein
MAGEPERELPDDLRRWVDDRAAASDEDPAAILERAVTLYRLVEERAAGDEGEQPPAAARGGVAGSDHPADLADLAARVDDVAAGLDAVDERVAGVEDDLDEKITDVRERVIQVKRETDAKAPADHDHEGLRTRIDDVERTVDRGFDNYEEILSTLVDEADERDEKLSRLAGVVVSLRRRTAAVEERLARIDAAADLKEAANRHGDRTATCEACGGTVAIGLLSEPTCPHCETGFVDVDPSGRLFRSATLRTGSPPALTAGDDPDGAARDGQSPPVSANGGDHHVGRRDGRGPADRDGNGPAGASEAADGDEADGDTDGDGDEADTATELFEESTNA